MKVKAKVLSTRRILNTPFKVSVFVTPLAVGFALVLEWLFTGIITSSTVFITVPVSFGMAYFVTGMMFKHQKLMDEKNHQLRKVTEDLRDANRMMSAQNEELDAFAQTVAHELKTPLGVIVGYSHLLGKDDFSTKPERVRSTADQITQTSLKMNDIIQEMLLLASLRRVEDIQIYRLDMEHIIDEALQRLDNLILETQAKIKTPETWPTVNSYGPWIEEVWINYISNALKYGGRTPRIELGAEEHSNGQVRFWVRDYGQGMTATQQARAFKQFTRFNPAKVQGHGLGLSISQRIIEKLGGEVGVESHPQNGSIFYFTLPSVS